MMMRSADTEARDMQRVRLDQLPRPFVVAVITEPTVRQASRVIADAASDGADAFELNLPPLGDIAATELARLIDGAPAPVYVTCRRRAFMAVYGYKPARLPDWSDEERMTRSLAAVDAGAVALDMELDTFDPRPGPAPGSREAARLAAEPGPACELSSDVETIERQVAIARETHARGGQVLMSCHTGRPQGLAGLRDIATAARARGGDLLKVVMPCRDDADLAILRQTGRLLASADVMPFVLVGTGPGGHVTRQPAGSTGSAWLFARPRGARHTFAEHPSVTELAAAIRARVAGRTSMLG